MSRRSHRHRGPRQARPEAPEPRVAGPTVEAVRPAEHEVTVPGPGATGPAGPAASAEAPTAILTTDADGPRMAPRGPDAAVLDRPGRSPEGGGSSAAVCTAPQLRRFIKSRAWVPMHELRRRFGINGSEDDVTPVAVAGATIFVGLPPREGQLLGELLRAGDIGYELSLDPASPIVIGVYPMRPVPRH